MVSVVAPGICSITAGIAALLHVQHPDQLWTFIVVETREVSTPLAIILGLNLVAMSFIAGYIFRSLAFRLVGFIEKVPDADTFLTQLKLTCGEQIIDSCLRAHSQLAHHLRNATDGQLRNMTHGGGHKDHYRILVLNYCKDRLRETSPALNVENIEAEINILTSCLFPTLFITTDIVWIGNFPLSVDTIVTLSCAGAWTAILGSAIRLRRTESISAMINLAYSVGAQPATPAGPPEN
ncbi:hypothetical protein [Streptomyces sp. NPDC057403]|uniref:hypothetical protein n=1 Tax=Streptomyces sp. NPDC057403 TaxID=3346119 RepID=UPI00368C093E